MNYKSIEIHVNAINLVVSQHRKSSSLASKILVCVCIQNTKKKKNFSFPHEYTPYWYQIQLHFQGAIH